jgi:two-component system NtrC family sensor kinase
VNRRRATSREPAKAQQATKAKRGVASKATRNQRLSALSKDTEIARLTRELAEAREHQTATADVLKVISRSAFDLLAVLGTLVEDAVRLCDADRGVILRQDGELYRVAASFGNSPEWIEIMERNPIHKDRTSATGRAVLERCVVHIHDILADAEYRWADDHRGDEEMHRTIVAIPMLREGAVIGSS